jgi:transcriptional regulator with XRE-family HTH domain
MEPLQVKEEFIQLRAKGWSYDKIAEKLGKAKQTLIDWSKELQEEIANRKALELEALYELYHLHREQRIKDFAQVVKSLREEILNRDLADVPTEKLLDLFLKYGKQLEEELIDPEFKSSKEIAESKEERNLLEGADLSQLTEEEVATLLELQNKLAEAPDKLKTA